MMDPRDIYDGIRHGLAVASLTITATLISLAAIIGAAIASAHILTMH